MPYTQAGRPIALTTPLGDDVFLLEKFTATEGVSALFCFQLELLAQPALAPGGRIDFGAVLGQRATLRLTLANGTCRLVQGILSRLTQGPQVLAPDPAVGQFLRFRAELVPDLWLLTRQVQSRVFQHQSVADILYQVLRNEWQLRVDLSALQGQLRPRDYCVQYRESDFAFLSRLLEEEGLSYYFRYEPADAPTSRPAGTCLVVTGPDAFPALPVAPQVRYGQPEGGAAPEPRVLDWEKSQEVCPGQYTLRDYSFEQAGVGLEASSPSPPGQTVRLGAAAHALRVGASARLEIYDYPAGVAHRFDGINKGGGEQAGELNQLQPQLNRSAQILRERWAAQSLGVRGTGTAGHFAPGFTFELRDHFEADDTYLLTQLEQTADLSGVYTTAPQTPLLYENQFACVPAALPYRPPAATPRPRVEGTQTAVVVGPPGEEIWCDKFGRVKVRFHWDRLGPNGDNSCWVRVSQAWAGAGFGALELPRVG